MSTSNFFKKNFTDPKMYISVNNVFLCNLNVHQVIVTLLQYIVTSRVYVQI